MPQRKLVSDEEILKSWVDNPQMGITKLSKLVGIRYESYRARIDKLVGKEARVERGKILTGRYDHGNGKTRPHKPNDEQKKWGRQPVIRSRKPRPPKDLRRWYGESEEQFQARKRAATNEQDPAELQRQLRAQSKIAARLQGDPDRPIS